MQIINKFLMFHLAVKDMPKAKAFYADKLGLNVATDYRKDDDNWWVALTLPEGGVTVTLTTHHGHMKPGALTLYFATSDIEKAQKELSDKGVAVGEVKDDLYGPGSGVKFFQLHDPDGNLIHIQQA
jgi:predicted enzyme related to lactoylglutathione lyase